MTHLGEGWPPCHWLSVCQPLCDKRSQLTLTSVTSDIQGICDVWDFCEIYVSETILPSGGKRSWCSRPEWNAQSQPRGRACKNLKIRSRLKVTVRKNKRKCGCEKCLMKRTDGIVALLEAKKGSSRTRARTLHPALHGVSYLCFKNTGALRPA